jgi:predicted AAA+ superfamily ATPase
MQNPCIHSLRLESLPCKQSKKAYLFFDEIQDVEDWEKAVNSLRIKPDTDMYLTGSNSKMLSGELASHLTGRYVEFTIHPFSFKEFLVARNADASIANQFNDYLTLGGMPFFDGCQF